MLTSEETAPITVPMKSVDWPARLIAVRWLLGAAFIGAVTGAALAGRTTLAVVALITAAVLFGFSFWQRRSASKYGKEFVSAFYRCRSTMAAFELGHEIVLEDEVSAKPAPDHVEWAKYGEALSRLASEMSQMKSPVGWGRIQQDCTEAVLRLSGEYLSCDPRTSYADIVSANADLDKAISKLEYRFSQIGVIEAIEMNDAA